MAREPWTVVLNAGGIGGLVTCAMWAGRGRVAMVYVHDGRPSDERRHDRFLRQAMHFSAARRVELAMGHLSVVSEESQAHPIAVSRSPLGSAQLVLAAAGVAAQLKAERLVWGVRCGEDFEAVARVTEAVQLLGDLCAAERGQELAVETPLLEMTPKQVVEVGHQMEVPWELSRSCQAPRSEPCGRCDGCQRRQSSFNEAGLDDALHLAATG